MSRIPQVRKRDGRLVPFRRDKIADAIYRAARAVGGEDRFLAEELAGVVTMHLERRGPKPPTIEDVQDVVERVLIETGHARTAKAYILYRDRRAAARAARAAAEGALPLVGGNEGEEAAAWSKARLVEALVRADGLDRAEAEEVARAVEERILRSGVPRLSTPLVTALVRAELFDRGRVSHLGSEVRAAVPHGRVRRWLDEGPEARRAESPATLAQALGEEVLRHYVLEEVLPAPVAEAHRTGDLHLYDLGSPLALAAVALPAEALIRRHLHGEEVSRPAGPRRITAALGEILRRYAPYASRRLAIEDVNVLLAPYLSHLSGDDDALAETIREWLLSPDLAAFPARGGLLDLELGITADVPARLAPLEPPAPAAPGRCYGDAADAALEVGRVLLREVATLRRRGLRRGARFTLLLPRSRPRDAAARALVREALATAAEVGEPVIVFQDAGTPTRGSRWLRLSESLYPDPLRFADGDVSVASATSLNLVAAALRGAAGGVEAWTAEAARLLGLALEGAKARVTLLEQSGEEPGRTLYPLRRGPLPLVDLECACHLVEPVGVERAVALLAPGADLATRRSLRGSLLEHLQEKLAEETARLGLFGRLAEGLGPEAGVRFARLDAARYGAAAAWWPEGAVPTYQLPPPMPGEPQREAAWPCRGRGERSFERVLHRVDAEQRPPVEDLERALEAAAADAHIVEYALEPWPRRVLTGEALGR